MRLLNSFLATPTGQRLTARVRAVEYRNAIQGCLDAFHTTHSAGKAAGFHEAWNYVESLSISHSASDMAETDMQSAGQGEPTLHERYAP